MCETSHTTTVYNNKLSATTLSGAHVKVRPVHGLGPMAMRARAQSALPGPALVRAEDGGNDMVTRE